MSLHVCGPYCTPSLGVHAWTLTASLGMTHAEVIECSYFFHDGQAEVIDLRRCEDHVTQADEQAFTREGRSIPLARALATPRQAWLLLLWFPPWACVRRGDA